jgi:hypothetical protein
LHDPVPVFRYAFSVMMLLMMHSEFVSGQHVPSAHADAAISPRAGDHRTGAVVARQIAALARIHRTALIEIIVSSLRWARLGATV